MFLSCCNTELYRDLNQSPKRYCISSLSDNLDVVDNPNAWETVDISLENKILFETMKCEKNRWDSFDKKWPLQFINIEELVASGFFYLQSDDKVQCAFCKLILCSWKVGDKPLKEHIKASPKCPLLLKPASANVVKQFSDELNLPHFNHNKPKNLRMMDIKERLSTFRNWPHATIKIQDLAECGLYYIGVQDVVTCFYCGGSLSNWEPSDEPIVEHAKFYPKCNYLRIIQSRPVYKRLKSVGSNIAVQACGNLPSDQIQVKEVLESDVVQKAKEIFPSSMVEEVVVEHLQRGEMFSSLHHLCEKLLEHDTRIHTRMPKMVDLNGVENLAASLSVKRLEKQNTDILLCKICMDNEREVVFQPCGHLISCEKCAVLLTKCPLCRKHIESRMRTFLS